MKLNSIAMLCLLLSVSYDLYDWLLIRNLEKSASTSIIKS